MNLLQKHFDTALESPDGIKKLRELILTLAMQGKLVKQDPNDQPASELLKDIQAEKEQLIKEGKIKKQKELPPIKPEEVPYEVPKGWEWVRLSDCSKNIHYGYTASADFQRNEIRLLRITDIQNNQVNWELVPGCEINKNEVEKYLLQNNDILIARTGGTVGKTYLVDDITVKAIFASYLIRVIPSAHIYIYFLRNNLESSFYWKQLYEKCSGTGQPNVNGVSLSTLLIPLPPLAEQKRIVAKIDELMALCDKLETQRNACNEKGLAVHTAAINQLLSASGNRDFYLAWKFITRHFDPLYSVKENVTELKKAILTLAMQGKLVKQDPNDQPASELLKEIQVEKERLIKEGKIKKQKELPPIKSEEVPYEVPEGWVWTRLGEIVLSITGGGTPNKNNSSFWGGNILWASVKDLNVDLYLNSTIDHITEEGVKNSSTNIIPKESIIVCTRMGLGKIAINSVEVAINQDLKALRLSTYVSQMYFIRKYKNYQIVGSGMTVSGIKQDVLLSYLFPLPPLAEQKRIVAKIDELMALCDKLENQIDQATAKQTSLFDAVLAQVH